MKITRYTQPDVIACSHKSFTACYYIGDQVSIYNKEDDSEHLWMSIKQFKELAQMLPEFIKEMEKAV